MKSPANFDAELREELLELIVVEVVALGKVGEARWLRLRLDLHLHHQRRRRALVGARPQRR
jgi:hypothetical protein